MTLRRTQGDIWALFDQGRTIVVTTNIGWDPENDNQNNMGAGTALEAWSRFPWLACRYGAFCREHGPETPVLHLPEIRLVLFPVKPLTPQDPERSWDQLANTRLIERSAKQLAVLRVASGPIALTLPGCGNGGLNSLEVLPLLERILPADHFELVDRRPLHEPRRLSDSP